ncbi:MAG: hypothetical protein Phog2KO_01290 [Phototrophicaceae bacterium]
MTAKTVTPESSTGFFQSKRGRTVIENLTAYAFLTPAFLIIFTFGLFPVAFAFFVSLHRWRRFPEGWRGLDNYVDALGNFAYIAFFWLAIGAFIYGIYTLWRLWKETGESQQRPSLSLLIPGIALTATAFTFINWFFTLIPVIFDVPVRLRGQELSREIFVGEFFNSFSFPQVLDAANWMYLSLLVTVILTVAVVYLLKPKRAQHYLSMILVAGLGFMAGIWLMNLTLVEVNFAIAEAQELGETLPIWSQTIMISAGAVLMGFGFWLWNRTVNDQEASNYIIKLLAVVVVVVGGIFLIRELPLAFAEADNDVFQGFSVTVMYSIFSVPFQLGFGMILAVLLFQKIRAKSLFRVVFFMPYITPFVATSVVFALLFSPNENSLVNQMVGFWGIEPQLWLQQPQGIFQLIFGEAVPDFLAGPSLALLVIIIYNIWIYAGFCSVIFLAGLGNIPEDVYEAARIDGANGWHQFRFITLPLLSPTTFFLILISTIGTFQAFTQIFLMRRTGAYDAVNTINLYIYDEITRSSPNYAYGSAMAFVLFAVILILTLVQNNIAGRRVFYG